MLVPQYWAEGRAHQPRKGRDGRQVTVRRWGWSDESQEAAQRHADQRAQEGLARIQAGELQLTRREPKVPYNGAEGVPIREEIVARHGETVITRNSYGALCLNTPNVLFADVDFATPVSFVDILWQCALYAFAGAGCAKSLGMGASWVITAAMLGLLVGPFAHDKFASIYRAWRGGSESIAMRRIAGFVSENPSWRLSVYRTPAGLRVLATHDIADPRGDNAKRLFDALASDPIYVQMCRRQACFRARVSPKPWRVGLRQHLKPRPGKWPIKAERLPDRRAWIEAYEQAAQGYASCRYLDTLGSAQTCPVALEVQRLHDDLCKAHSDLPIA